MVIFGRYYHHATLTGFSREITDSQEIINPALTGRFGSVYENRSKLHPPFTQKYELNRKTTNGLKRVALWKRTSAHNQWQLPQWLTYLFNTFPMGLDRKFIHSFFVNIFCYHTHKKVIKFTLYCND